MMEGWKVKSIQEFAKTTSGGTPSRTRKDFYGGDILWVKSGELNDNYIDDTEEKITEEAVNKSSAKIFPVGTVLMAMYGATVGKTAILNAPASTNQAVCGIIPYPNECDNEFLRYQLMFKREDFLKQRYGGAQPNISQTIIKTFDIVLPPISEQRKIAYILSTVQKAIEQQDKLIRHTTELKKALMQKLFTEGAKGERQKQTEIGLVPESWEVVELGDVCERVSVKIQPDPNGDKPYVGLEHMVSGQTYLTSWGKEIEVVSSKAVFKKGEILYGKLRPYLDKAVIAQFDGISSTDILIFTGKDNVPNDFLIHFFHTESLIDFAKSTTTGVQHPRTSWSSLKKLKLGLPSKPERKLIAQTLNLFEDKLSFHLKKKQTLTSLFKTLLHELMTGQRRVHEIEFDGLTQEYELKEQPLSMAAEK